MSPVFVNGTLNAISSPNSMNGSPGPPSGMAKVTGLGAPSQPSSTSTWTLRYPLHVRPHVHVDTIAEPRPPEHQEQLESSVFLDARVCWRILGERRRRTIRIGAEPQL